MALDAAHVLDVDPAHLSHADRLALLTGIEHARAALDHQQQRVLAELAASDPSEQQWVRDEVACALQIAPMTAASKLHEAVELVDRLPLTTELLADATIQLRHARVLVEHTRHLDDATRAKVERRVLRRAAGKTVSEFRQAVRRAVASFDPRDCEQRHADSMTDRRVVLTPQDNAMTEFWALLPADGAARLMACITGLAGTLDDPADSRTADQKRADVLVELPDLICPSEPASAGSGGGAGGGATAPGRGPRVEVVVGLGTLLGLDDQPGELTGHGPIPASMARQLADDPTGTWRRILIDTAGRVLSASPQYRPPARLADHVAARDRTCRFPGCRRPAVECEDDHIRARQDGGDTSIENLHELCRRHHHLKHDGPGWLVFVDRDGSTVWRAPSGRRYEKEAASYDEFTMTDDDLVFTMTDDDLVGVP